MTDRHHGNIALQWTNIFFQALSKYGVKHIVVSPGSRSTPLTLAVASNPHLQKHVILDERSAAFTALGIGKATDTPAVLICTSGTALANYYPAVIEARQSGVPMILVTADRPPHLRATGANQAIDQLKIFGDYPVFFHEVGEPESGTKDLQRLNILAKQSVSLSREKRGPVHLNFPFRKSLEPTDEMLKKIEKENKNLPNSTAENKNTSTALSLSTSLQKILSSVRKPLIIIGPTAPSDDVDSISKLGDKLDAPVLTESSIDSPNTIRGFAGILRNKDRRNQLEPDVILRFGFQPTSKSLATALEEWNPQHHFHFSSTNAWQDATFSGAERIAWMGQKIHIENITTNTGTTWIENWKQTEHEFANYYQKTINRYAQLTDGSIYHQLTPQIPEDHFIAVSNSFPARDVNLFGQHTTNLPLFVNRGASGIDGITSTALGVSKGLEKSGVLFTGDLAFLHDTNALLNHKNLAQSLVVVVINNGGGSIFRMLPIHNNKQHFEPYFETPQNANIRTLVSAYDIPHYLISSLSELKKMDLASITDQNKGLSVIECQTDAEASMELRNQLWNF
ncbi:2-succinyl-5-enolpyruvyl-6-hydroxy-3-cyclohexene-1-carboxylic-acid synthase [Aliifodinibius salipaludis]|uniref:2-succinyl-5-enolpyruvyl-6-hydroxy-3-cyclohexene-1-carboxylate synthase n=1 Tax=Fodinibius salipaludis TaxID=2032627 RepID=A0A2A2GFM1_9BACT|nr:2-succinyl-5-enolpyruvyl-6-hydroxy-3-cyclohexene-1-carboxylic-acid synthase [Aliifodinibius salipaludis]PAU95693.1 2-succinyl-5-enolpyruvyl-6-hydroxy-3-cyclohexene-1-carboxylic-acid synthase [Aliifodinibius salipaludis]